MFHPFLSLLPGRRARVLAPLVALAVAAWLGLRTAEQPLYTVAAPKGRLSLALAGDPVTALWIVKNWENTAGALPMVYLGIGLSFFWLAAASTALSLACVISAQQLPGSSWMHLGVGLAWGQWLAALLGALGNIAMLLMMQGTAEPFWVLTARWCTIGQITLFALGILFAAGGIVVRLAVAAMPERFGYF